MFVTWSHWPATVCSPGATSGGGCDLVLPTLSLPEAKKRGQASATPSPPHPGVERVYKGRTQTVLQSPSQRHQRRNSGIFAVLSRRSGLDKQSTWGSTGWYEGLHITLYGASPVQGRDGTTEYEEKTLVQSMKVLTEINLRTLQDKTFLAWDTAYKSEHSQSWDTACKSEHFHHGTLQIMGHLVSVHSIYSVLLNSFSMMYIVLRMIFIRSLSILINIFTNSFSYYFHLKSK